MICMRLPRSNAPISRGFPRPMPWHAPCA